ncbi:MAG: GNAT family N-acetyltransferase [Alphaproteobacteria bacterium]|nr:GNAT family N-acetyltransferase [Alphaproteobacteria bacterium]
MSVIRPARPADLEAITAIYADAVENSLVTWDYDAPTIEQMRRRYEDRTAEGYPFIVSETTAGSIQGYASGGPFHPQSGFRFVIENSIYIAAQYRRQGLGQLLLQALIEEAANRGFRHMIAGISMPGGEASLAFHEALGFKNVGTLPSVGWKHGQWLSAVYLHRALGPGSTSPPPLTATGSLPESR